MARFEAILKGKRNRKTIEFPTRIDAADPDGKTLVDLVVLAGDEESSALEAALAYAKRKGVHDPKGGDPQYDLGLMVHTLARALLDHDEPGSFVFFATPSDDRQNFNAAADALLSGLDRERIQYLYTLYQVWQDESAPWRTTATEDEIFRQMKQLRGVVDPAVPFSMWRPGLVGSLLLSTVNRLYALLEDRSPDGSFSETSTGTSTSESPVPEAETP